MEMTKRQEKSCVKNIQSYLRRIEWLRDKDRRGYGPRKSCDLCETFNYSFDNLCKLCPLGPRKDNCISGNTGKLTYLDDDSDFKDLIGKEFWGRATITQLKARMKWLLGMYKKAGLDIEIKEEA